MILNVQRGIHEAIDGAIRQRFGVAEVPAFAVEVPPTRALGDLAVPVAFQLARALQFRGTPVEVQNYIDDTGVQVADVIVGFRELERKSIDEVRQLAASPRFDYYCWDLYARVTEWYEGDRARLAVRAAALHDL